MKRWSLVVLFLLFLLLTTGVAANSIEREYQIRQAGVDIGRITIDLAIDEAETRLNTNVKYPDLNVEVESGYIFSGTDFPKKPQQYWLSLIEGGVLDFELNWNDKTEYTIAQLNQTEVLPTDNVLALDNNVISDYMVATWIYDKASDDTLHSNLILPIQILQLPDPIAFQISFVGEETVGDYVTDHFQVKADVVINLWVDQTDRSLIKLSIPAQAYEIAATTLEPERVADTEVIYDDFGGLEFTEEEVTVTVDNASISGTLTTPLTPSSSKMPAVVIVAGSGPTDRDGNSLLLPGQANYLKELAHYLATNEIVVLRYDKRGLPSSPGPITAFRDYIEDASSMVDMLRSYDYVDLDQIYILGHSEGAYIASEVACMRDDLAGIGLLSGSGYSFFDTITRQLTEQSEAAIDLGMFDAGLTERIVFALDSLLESLQNNLPYDIQEFDLPPELEEVILSLAIQGDIILEWLIADPVETLSEVEVPVLILQGTADSQVLVDDANRLASALPENQREVHIIPGVDHVMKMTFGEPLSYTDPDRRVEPQILTIVRDWILR